MQDAGKGVMSTARYDQSVNILLIGRTGCGKKTVANHIFGSSNEESDHQLCEAESQVDDQLTRSCKPDVRFQTAGSLLSSAQKARFIRQSFKRVKSMEDADVNVGIADISSQCGAPVKDSDVWRHIKSLCPRHEIHLILFVLTKSDIDDEEDLDKQHFFKITRDLEEKVEMCDEIYRHFAVVVTRCDGLNDQAKETLTHKVKASKVGVTIKIEEERIFCVTFPSMKKLDQEKRKLLEEEVEHSSKQLQDFAKKSIGKAVIKLKEEAWWRWPEWLSCMLPPCC